MLLSEGIVEERSKSILDRTKAPRPRPAGRISFPKYFKHDYRNGLRIFVVENHQLPIVSIGVVLRSGAAYDAGLPGLSSVVCELVTKGTRKRSATQIAEEIDFVGGALSNNVSWDASQVFVSVLKHHLREGFDVLSDVVLNPTFPEKEIKRVKTQRIAAIRQMKADPGYLAETAFASVVFGDHPYGSTISGTEKSVDKMRRRDLVDFYRRHFTPDNTFIVFAGDITPGEAQKFVSKYFSKWKGKSNSEIVAAPKQETGRGRLVIADKPGAVQSSIRIGHIGITRDNPDFLKVFVMNTLLGGYFSSRINMNLREVHGYTYGGRTDFDARLLPGAFQVSADVRNEVTSETIDEVMNELRRIRDTLPSKDEMTMVKNYLTGLFPIQLETPQQVAGRVVAIELYNLPANYYRNYRENIRKITARDIKTVARKYIRPESAHIVLSGDANEIRRKLERLGTVEVLAPNGTDTVKNTNKKS